MSINETPYTYNHTIVCPLPLAEIDGTSTTTTKTVLRGGLHDGDLTAMGGYDTVEKAVVVDNPNVKNGTAFTNTNDSIASPTATGRWTYINVLNPFDPLPYQDYNTPLNSETVDVLNRYRRYRVMGVTAHIHFLTTPDQSFQSGSQYQLPLIFGVNKMFHSQHRENPSILCWNAKEDSAPAQAGSTGFHINDYMTWEDKNGQDVCCGGGWRQLSGNDAPLILKWSRFAHYYDQSKFDKEWSDILFNNTVKIQKAIGGPNWGAAGDDTSDAQIAEVPYYRFLYNDGATALNQLGERPIYWEPYGLCPGHYGVSKEFTGTAGHPSIQARYRVVLKYHVEFSEPLVGFKWKNKTNLTMDQVSAMISAQASENQAAFQQLTDAQKADNADVEMAAGDGATEKVQESNVG